jgi:hypothetical protein
VCVGGGGGGTHLVHKDCWFLCVCVCVCEWWCWWWWWWNPLSSQGLLVFCVCGWVGVNPLSSQGLLVCVCVCVCVCVWVGGCVGVGVGARFSHCHGCFSFLKHTLSLRTPITRQSQLFSSHTLVTLTMSFLWKLDLLC